MDIWLIALTALTWYGAGMWGSVIGIRSLNAHYNTKTSIFDRIFGVVAALLGPFNILLVLLIVRRP